MQMEGERLGEESGQGGWVVVCWEGHAMKDVSLHFDLTLAICTQMQRPEYYGLNNLAIWQGVIHPHSLGWTVWRQKEQRVFTSSWWCLNQIRLKKKQKKRQMPQTSILKRFTVFQGLFEYNLNSSLTCKETKNQEEARHHLFLIETLIHMQMPVTEWQKCTQQLCLCVLWRLILQELNAQWCCLHNNTERKMITAIFPPCRVWHHFDQQQGLKWGKLCVHKKAVVVAAGRNYNLFCRRTLFL